MKHFRSVLLFISCTLLLTPVYSQGSHHPQRFILRDEGLSQLSYVDVAHPGNNWHEKVPAGRDLQLVGGGRVLIGTGSGYEEREILTGKKVDSVEGFESNITARRLRNGNTLLVGLNQNGKKGIVLTEVDPKGQMLRLINYPQFSYVRLVRETPSGTLLVTSDTVVFEGDPSGTILWTAKIASQKRPHAWQALRCGDGQTVVSSGYAGNLQFFSADGHPVGTITGPDEVRPNFFSGLQILNNGNFVVANWQGHGPGHGSSGIQLLEYNRQGKLVWSWKQDPDKFSSIQGVIVLDGLDLNRLHVENGNGVLSPVGSEG